MPDVGRGKKINFYPLCAPGGSLKNWSGFGLAVWPAIAKVYSNIYIYRAFLYRSPTKEPCIAREKKIQLVFEIIKFIFEKKSFVYGTPEILKGFQKNCHPIWFASYS